MQNADTSVSGQMKRSLIFPAIVSLSIQVGEVAAQERPRYGGTLEAGLHSDLYGVNPFVCTRSIDRSVRSISYEPLVAMDSKFQVKPFLAESWKISADGKEYMFPLHRKVKFHNGQEMTADDIKWAVGYGQDPRHRR
jgi:peptide/nickel transport system substrate-binding protein